MTGSLGVRSNERAQHACSTQRAGEADADVHGEERESLADHEMPTAASDSVAVECVEVGCDALMSPGVSAPRPKIGKTVRLILR